MRLYIERYNKTIVYMTIGLIINYETKILKRKILYAMCI